MSEPPATPRPRNLYIDSIRGIAAVSIILIHTAFWTGQSYVPLWARSLTLLVSGVSLLFFLSGWATSLSPSRGFLAGLRSLRSLYVRWAVFVLFYSIVGLGYLALKGGPAMDLAGLGGRMIRMLFFVGSPDDPLPVVPGSVWFFRVFFVVMPVFTFFMAQAQSSARPGRAIWLVYSATLFLLGSSWLGQPLLPIDAELLFYGSLFSLGYALSQVDLRWPAGIALLAAVGAGIAVVTVLSDQSILDLQAAKFPPQAMYFLSSLLLVVVILVIKRSPGFLARPNPLTWVGRQGLYFYFCQGISSSLLIEVVERVDLQPGLKLAICFGVNLVVTVILVIVFKATYELLERTAKAASARLLALRRPRPAIATSATVTIGERA